MRMRDTIGTPLTLERRAFLRMGAGLGLGSMLVGWANPARAEVERIVGRAAEGEPRGSARNVLLVFLGGGQSHIDTLDLKEGSWTPASFGVANNKAGYKWPVGLMPGLAARSDIFS